MRSAVKKFMSAEPAAHLARDRAASLARSGSVKVMIAGWHPSDGDLDSFSLCTLIRDGGVRLGEAMRLVERVLDGENVTACLPFANHDEAVAALTRIGAHVLAPELVAGSRS